MLLFQHTTNFQQSKDKSHSETMRVLLESCEAFDDIIELNVGTGADMESRIWTGESEAMKSLRVHKVGM